jgi:uncharacterized protein (DUF3820 family)
MKTIFYDTDPMPFGKYMGIQLANVPASYLIWLYENDRCGKDALYRYIRDNIINPPEK